MTTPEQQPMSDDSIVSDDIDPSTYCADCAGFDIEWMYYCNKHGLYTCRGCSCPDCDEEAYDENDGYWWEDDER